MTMPSVYTYCSDIWGQSLLETYIQSTQASSTYCNSVMWVLPHGLSKLSDSLMILLFVTRYNKHGCFVITPYSCSFSDCTAADKLLQSVHFDLYLHHLTCYHCRVDKGWNHTVLWWVSLPALTGGDRQTVFYLWQHSDFNLRPSQCCRLFHQQS